MVEWRFTVALRHILNSVRTKERGLFLGYCRDFAVKRFEEGFDVVEVVRALQGLNQIALDVLSEDPEAGDLEEALQSHLSMTIEFGCDQILEIYEDLSGEAVDLESSGVSPE
ncbi:MAG: hypothetical protein E4H44_04440 [Candidatus Aminicenantes bacterium]|nr:MAG: hypothetical protein E4H44_04440 [Candidatus Aminicenantes bacterium]